MSKFDEAYLQSLIKTLFPSLLSKQQNLEFAKQMRNGDTSFVERVISSDLPPQHSASTTDDINSSDMGLRKGLLGLFEGNSWSARTFQNVPRTYQAAFALTYDSGILAGGENSTGVLGDCERYSDFFDTWVNITSLPVNKSGLVAATLTSDLGLTIGGNNGSGYVATTERYSASANTWTVRSTLSIARGNSAAFSLTNDSFVIAGGTNGSLMSDCDQFVNSINTWQAVGLYPTSLAYGCGLSITNEGGLVCGGNNGAWDLLNTTNRYSVASSSWVAKTNLSNVRTTFMNTGMTLSQELGLISGGQLHSYTWYLFNESSEIYITSMNTWLVSIAATSPRCFSSAISLNFNSGLMVGGITRPSPFTLQPPERYRNGIHLLNYLSNGMYIETTLMGQQINPLSITYAPASWSTVANMNIYRMGQGGAGSVIETLAFGGQSSSPSPVSEKWSGSSWSTTASLHESKSYVTGCGNATNALCIGGNSSGSRLTTTEIWSTSSWATTGALNDSKCHIGSCGTVSAALCFGGHNSSGTSSSNKTEKWDGSAWGTTGNLSQAKNGMAGCGTTTDALAFGGQTQNSSGWVAVTEKWSSGAWQTVSAMNTARANLAGCGTTLSALVYGGENASIYFTSTEKWNSSAWSTTIAINVGRTIFAGCGSTSGALAFGGTITGGSLSKGTEKWFDQVNAGHTYTYDPCPSPAGKENFIYTNRLSNQQEPIDKIYVSALYYKKPNSNPPTFDFSLDDGWTYKEDLPFDVYYDSQGIKPLDENYKLKLRFELKRDSNINTWTTLVNTPQYRSWPTTVTLTNDLGIMTGGYTGSAVSGSNYRYQKSTNLYASRAINISGYAYYNGQGLTLSTDQALVVGGNNISGNLATTQKYFDSQNLWVAKLNHPYTRSGSMSLNTTAWSGVLACGFYNGGWSGITNEYSSSTDSWITYTSNLTGRKDGGSNCYDSSNGVVFGGSITGDAPIANNEKFSRVANTWTSRNSMIFAKQDFGSCSLTSSFGMQAGGNNSSTSLTYDCSKFFDLQNVWLSRASISLGRSGTSGFSFDTTSGTLVGGGILTSLETLRYNDGETILYGFSVIGPISKIDPIIRNNDDVYITTDRPYTYAPLPDPRVPLKAINPDPYDYEIDVPDYAISPIIIVGGGWSITNSMNATKNGLAGCGTTTDALGFGGHNGSTVLATSEKWNGTIWSTTGALSQARYYLAGCGTTSDALAFGGNTNNSTSSSDVSLRTDKWSVSSWSTTTSLNRRRHRLGGCGNTTDALSFGGWNGSYLTTTEIWLLGSSWSTTSALPEAREEMGGCGITSAALLAGGYISTPTFYNTTRKWDGSSWSTTPANSIVKREMLAMCGTTLDALAFGGENGVYISVTEKWSGTAWATTLALNLGRSHLGGCGTTTDALSFAGSSGSNVPLSEIWSDNGHIGETSGGEPTKLLWDDGGNSLTYDVYFSPDSSIDPGDKKTTDQVPTSYDRGNLLLSHTYYWRIDSRNGYGTATGDIWRFTTNTQPSGDLGLIGGGHNGSGSARNIQWIRVNNLSNAQSWGNLTQATHLLAAGGNELYGIFAGGDSNNTWQGDTKLNNIQYTTYATMGSMSSWGHLTSSTTEHGGCSNRIRMIIAGGSNSSQDVNDGIEYFDLASTGNASNFGQLTTDRDQLTGCANPITGLFIGGHTGASTILKSIDYVSFVTLANANNFGDLQKKRVDLTAFSSHTNVVFFGGDNGSTAGSGPYVDLMEYAKFAVSGGTCATFGTLSPPYSQSASVSNKIYGVISGGYNGSIIQSMQYVTIATVSGVAPVNNFGDLAVAMRSPIGTSNCHGGL